MRLKLKEDPHEWQKFTWIACAVALLVSGLLFRRGAFPFPALISVWTAVALIAFAAVIRPGWFRHFYRGAMTASFRMGQVVQAILLSVVYFFLLVPLSLILKISGRDLLGLQKRSLDSYWKDARKATSLNQQF